MNNTSNVSEEHQEFLNQFFLEGFIPPAKLYHYTNLGGFDGFFTGKTIWLTSHKFMNDYTEFTYGMHILGEKFKEFLKHPNYTPAFKNLCGGIWNLVETDSADPDLRPYIYCLSEARDDLSQWRAYADDGSGFCIEFDTNALQSIGEQILLGQVQYDEEMFEALCANFVQKWLELCEKTAADNRNTIPPNDMQLLARIFLQCAYVHMIKFKHRGFWAEREWRLIKFLPRHSTQLSYRKHRFGTADYFELSISPQGLVTEVLSGPKGTIANNVVSNVPTSIQCIKSVIPYA